MQNRAQTTQIILANLVSKKYLERVGMTKSVIIRHMSQGGLNDVFQRQTQTQLLVLFVFICKPLSV